MAAPAEILQQARQAAAAIAGRSDDIEAARRLPADVLRPLIDAGLFRLCVPRVLGGLEADPQTVLAAIECIARVDASAGWCVMIGATTGIVSGYLEPTIAAEIYGAARAITGGVLAPYGRAVACDGGYRVSGRWPFASGCEHCDWLLGGSLIIEQDGRHQRPGVAPESRMLLFPARAAHIVDTWSVSGLRGTGSHDIEVDGLFVPTGYAVSLVTDRPRADAALYRFPPFALLALSVAAVGLGIARCAIDALTQLAMAKTPSGSRRVLAQRGGVQTAVAEAEGALAAARAGMLTAVAEAWDAAQHERPIALAGRARLRQAAIHAAASCAHAVDQMYNAGGASAIYAASPLQRCFRDIHVLTQHVMVASHTAEMVGRVLLGIETDVSML